MKNNDQKLKGTLRRSRPIDARAKVSAAGEGNGFIEGYLAVFGNVDLGGDRIMPGAFAKSIAEYMRAGKVPLMAEHFAYGGDMGEMLGVITQAKEDTVGLWIHADFMGDEQSQAMRAKIQEASASGVRVGLSVGYRVMAYEIVTENDNTVYNLKELQLMEGTITLRPMNEMAGVTNSKTEDPELVSQIAAALMIDPITVSAALDQLKAGASANHSAATLQSKTATADTTDLDLLLNQNRIYLERLKC